MARSESFLAEAQGAAAIRHLSIFHGREALRSHLGSSLQTKTIGKPLGNRCKCPHRVARSTHADSQPHFLATRARLGFTSGPRPQNGHASTPRRTSFMLWASESSTSISSPLSASRRGAMA